MPLADLETSLTEEERAERDTAHRFARDVLRPVGTALDRLEHPADVIAARSALWGYPLTYRGAVVANKVIYFDIPKDLQLLSISIASTAILTDSSLIIILIKNTQQNISYPFTIKPIGIIPLGIVGVVANLPFLIISSDWKLEITVNFSITYLNIWAKEIFIEREILGRI